MSRRPLRGWLAGHRSLIVDGVVCILLMLLWSTGFRTVFNDGGLLFWWEPVPALLWCYPLTLPYALHRVRPTLAVRLFLAVALVQLVFGPATLFADAMALPMLYAALVYGDPGRTRTYLWWAFGLAAADALVCALSNTVTPVADWFAPRAGDDARPVAACMASADGSGLASPVSCATNIAGQAVFIGLFYGLALLMVTVAAFWQRARRQTVLLLTERNAAIEARQEEEKRIAASAERARIARDMHDVVAHTLSIIIVQADGGRYATVHDPAMACATMETIRDESEHALHDMKRLLGVFGDTAQPGLGQVPLLVEQARQASHGMAVTHTVHGTPLPGRLATDADTALYHVVQEALTNVRKYAGRTVRVQVTESWDPDGVAVTVVDDGRGAAASLDGHAPGFGLLGMRERVEGAGGTLTAGPGAHGGFTVAARIPYREVLPQAEQPAGSAHAAGAMGNAMGAGRLPADGTAAQPPLPHAAGPVPPAAATGAPQPQARTETDVPSPAPAGRRHAHAWGAWVGALRSQPFAQARDHAHANWVTRLSQWTERHYVLVDTLVALACMALVLTVDLELFLVVDPLQGPHQQGVVVALTLMLMLPLCLRRRFPRTVAAVFALLCTLQLLVLPGIYTVDLFALLAIYTAMLYGRGHVWRWMVPTVLALSALTGLKVGLAQYGYASILDRILGHRFRDGFYGAISIPHYLDARQAVEAGLQFGVATAMACMVALLLGAWARQKGENPQVLEARAQALQAEADKQRISAANRERDRISAQIQAEVSDTLRMVIDQTGEELDAIHAQLRSGATPTPESIGNAFAAIAARGRSALARMRELLGVLRETGFSDEHRDDGHMTMPLAPLAGTRSSGRPR